MALELIPENVLNLGKRIVFKKGEHLLVPHQHVTRLYFIKTGLVKVFIDHRNGRRSILDLLGHGSWIGEFSLFNTESNVKENTVIQEVDCLEFDVAEVRNVCLNDAAVAFYFGGYITQKFSERSYRMSTFMNYALLHNLALFILRTNESGYYHVPHTETAEYFNVSYRHVLHVFQKLCREGVLERSKGYHIIDYARLHEIAHEASE